MTFMVERGAGRIIALEILMSLETIIMINVYCGDTVFMFMLNDAHPMLSMSIRALRSHSFKTSRTPMQELDGVEIWVALDALS